MDSGILGELRPNVFQLGFLPIAGNGDVAAAPGRDAPLQRDVVEVTAAPLDVLQRPLWGWRGIRSFSL